MATNFPTSLDSFTNPSPSSKQGEEVGGRTHSEFHADINDAVETLQAKVGANSSAVTTSHDYKLSSVTSTDKAVSTGGNQTVGGDKTFTGVISATSALLTTPRITTSINDANGNEVIETPATGSAVNHIKVTNAATGNDASIEAAGDNTNVGLKIKGKGTGKVKLGDAELQFPDVDGGNGQALITDGAGTLSWTGISGSKLEIDTTEVTVTNTVTETTLFDYSIAGGVLSTNNGIRFKIYLSNYSQNTICAIRLKYGSTTIASIDMGSDLDFSGLKGFIEGFLVADGSTSAQKGAMWLQVFSQGTELSSGGDQTVGISKGFAIGNGTAAEDSTTSKTLAITAEWGVADSGSSLTAEFWIVDKVG